MPPSLNIRDLGAGVPFDDGYAMQQRLHANRVRDEIPDTLLLLEHSPVFTLGSAGKQDHVRWDDAARRRHGVALAHTTRGGDVTYHGPGQLVGYPILKLGNAMRQVVTYVTQLEAVLLACAAAFGVEAQRDRRNRGIWVGNAKLAAIGVRVSQGVTQHGFALNVQVNLGMYAGIVPCGLQNAGVISLDRLVSPCPEMALVKAQVCRDFRRVFGYAVADGADPP